MSLKANEQHDDEQIADVQARRGRDRSRCIPRSGHRRARRRPRRCADGASRATEARRAVHEIAWHKNRLRGNELICLPSPSASASASEHPRFTRVLLLIGLLLRRVRRRFRRIASWAMVCRAGRCPSAAGARGLRAAPDVEAATRPTAASSPSSDSSVERSSSSPTFRRSFATRSSSPRTSASIEHAGIDWMRVPGALLVDIKNRNFSEGFSTITMQLARNIFPERISRDKIADSQS